MQDTTQSTSQSATNIAPAWSDADLQTNPHAAPDKAYRVQRMFASIARRYDLNNRLHSLWRDQAWRRAAVALGQVEATDDVLDVACGTGDLALSFASAGARSVTGVDFTDPMLDVARSKAERHRRRMPGRAAPTFLHADATDLPFPDQNYDIVSIAFGIRNIADPIKALLEFRRVLRGGGRLVILEFSEPRNAILRALNAMYTRHIMPITATLIARDRSGAYRYLPKSIATFASPDQLASQLAACGFGSIESHPLTFGVCTATIARA